MNLVILKELNDNFDMLILSNKDSSILENKKIKILKEYLAS